jgi:hypothetical protein
VAEGSVPLGELGGSGRVLDAGGERADTLGELASAALSTPTSSMPSVPPAAMCGDRPCAASPISATLVLVHLGSGGTTMIWFSRIASSGVAAIMRSRSSCQPAPARARARGSARSRLPPVSGPASNWLTIHMVCPGATRA